MKNKLLNMKTSQSLYYMGIIFCSAALFFACAGGNGEEAIDEAVEVDEELVNDLNKAKQVFYSLPSPIETAMLMKRAGAKYNSEIMNPIENLANYSTNKIMALNLGVYSADLSFASMFDQSQASLKYLSATKTLADDLGILNAIKKSTIERMESNINNRDSLMEIISETFMNSNSFLKENERSETAAIILVGGWIEGLYIASQIAKATVSNNELIERIIDQRLSLATLMSLLKEYDQDNEDIASLLTDLGEIKAIFDQVEITTSKIEPVTDEETKITTLKGKTEISLKEGVFENLCEKVAALRNSITE